MVVPPSEISLLTSMPANKNFSSGYRSGMVGEMAVKEYGARGGVMQDPGGGFVGGNIGHFLFWKIAQYAQVNDSREGQD